MYQILITCLVVLLFESNFEFDRKSFKNMPIYDNHMNMDQRNP